MTAVAARGVGATWLPCAQLRLRRPGRGSVLQPTMDLQRKVVVEGQGRQQQVAGQQEAQQEGLQGGPEQWLCLQPRPRMSVQGQGTDSMRSTRAALW